MIQDANYDYQQLIYSKMWLPDTTDKNFNEPTVSKVYYAKIKTTVADALRKGGFSTGDKISVASGSVVMVGIAIMMTASSSK